MCSLLSIRKVPNLKFLAIWVYCHFHLSLTAVWSCHISLFYLNDARVRCFWWLKRVLFACLSTVFRAKEMYIFRVWSLGTDIGTQRFSTTLWCLSRASHSGFWYFRIIKKRTTRVINERCFFLNNLLVRQRYFSTCCIYNIPRGIVISSIYRRKKTIDKSHPAH